VNLEKFSQSENASEKGDWLRAENALELLENVAARCQSPFSRPITISVGPSGKWDRHQGSECGYFRLEN